MNRQITGMGIIKIAIALVAAGWVSACVDLNPYTKPLNVEAGPEPDRSQVDVIIHTYLASSLKDPDSLKQYELFALRKTRWMLGALYGGGSEEGWLACFTYNAKNSYGAYAGVKVDGLVFRSVDGQARIIPGAIGKIMSPTC